MKSELDKKTLRITLSGLGYTYSFFEVKDEDLPKYIDNDQGVYLRSQFKKYAEENRALVAKGYPNRMIQLCTISDDPVMPAEMVVTDGTKLESYHMRDVAKWDFVSVDDGSDSLTLKAPYGMPELFLRRLSSIFGECKDDATIDADAINNDYVSYFNMYGPNNRLLICMRTRDNVRSAFELSVDASEDFDHDKLRIFVRDSLGIGWDDDARIVEYDANNIVYAGSWVGGDVYSRSYSNADYFVSGANPDSDTAGWFESWAANNDIGACNEFSFKS